MNEQLRQLKMAWNRGFQLGLVAGILGTAILLFPVVLTFIFIKDLL